VKRRFLAPLSCVISGNSNRGKNPPSFPACMQWQFAIFCFKPRFCKSTLCHRK
jgi:hypothetical protein